MQEVSCRKAAHRIEELEQAKQRLEQEVHASRRRLEVESLAAKQASAPWRPELRSPGPPAPLSGDTACRCLVGSLQGLSWASVSSGGGASCRGQAHSLQGHLSVPSRPSFLCGWWFSDWGPKASSARGLVWGGV